MPKTTSSALLAIAALILPGCAVIPDAPNVVGTPVPAGTAVAIDRPVRLGGIVVTPKEVVEDSRCPTDVQCVWAGRLIVRTRIDGDGWRDTTDIRLGESYGTHGHVVALVSAEPGTVAGSETARPLYRFLYEAR